MTALTATEEHLFSFYVKEQLWKCIILFLLHRKKSWGTKDMDEDRWSKMLCGRCYSIYTVERFGVSLKKKKKLQQGYINWSKMTAHIHSPKGLLGTHVQFLINAII